MFAGKEYYSQSVCLRNVSVTISTTLMKRIYAASYLSRNVRWYHFKSAFFLHIIKGSRKQRRQTEEKTKDKKWLEEENSRKNTTPEGLGGNKQMVLFVMGQVLTRWFKSTQFF